MKYLGFNIRQDILTSKYNVFDVFRKKKIDKDFDTSKEAKMEVDSIIKAEEHKSNRFQPSHYSRYWWAIMDKKTGWYYKDANNKMVMFKTSKECFEWCDKNNEISRSLNHVLN